MPPRVFERVRDAFSVLAGRSVAPGSRTELETATKLFEQWNALRQEQFGHYDGGKTGRLQGDWPTSYDTPYWNLRSDRSKLIARSQKMVENNPTAKAILETIIADVIGTGLRPKARVKFQSGEEVLGINKQLDDGWKRYNDEYDATGHSTFYDMQQEILREIITCGAVLTNKVRSPDDSYLGVATQIVPVLRLDTSKDDGAVTFSDNPRVKQTVFGINIDELGRPVSYWIQGIAKPVSARNMIQVFRRMRAEEFTGVPWFAPALSHLWAHEQLTKDKLLASRVQAMIAMLMPDNMFNQLAANNRDSDDFMSFVAGKIYRYDPQRGKPELLQADDSIKEVLVPLQKHLLHSIAVSMGWSYQTITRDVGEINMAAGKINTQKDRQAARMIQHWYRKAYCQAEWNQFVYRMFLEGRIAGKSLTDYLSDPWKYNQCQWSVPGYEMIDPAREAQAIETMRSLGFRTMQQQYAEQGTDWHDAVDQLEDEYAYIDSKPHLKKVLGKAQQPPAARTPQSNIPEYQNQDDDDDEDEE